MKLSKSENQSRLFQKLNINPNNQKKQNNKKFLILLNLNQINLNFKYYEIKTQNLKFKKASILALLLPFNLNYFNRIKAPNPQILKNNNQKKNNNHHHHQKKNNYKKNKNHNQKKNKNHNQKKN